MLFQVFWKRHRRRVSTVENSVFSVSNGFKATGVVLILAWSGALLAVSVTVDGIAYSYYEIPG